MSKRKPNNHKARLERFFRSLLMSNHVAVVNVDPAGRQHLINWKSAKFIISRDIGNAVFDVTHRWTIYISALCIGSDGHRYTKSVELVTQHAHLVGDMDDTIEAGYRALLDGCNPKHLVGHGWIAIPGTADINEVQAAAIFDAVSAWPQQIAA